MVQAHSPPFSDHLAPRNLTTDAFAEELLLFFTYLACDLRLSHLNIDKLSSGLRFRLQLLRVPTEAFDHASVTKLRHAIRSSPDNQPVIRGRRLPYTLSMVRYAVTHNMSQGTTQHHMIAIGLLLAFFCLLRASEYSATTTDVHHAIRANAVEFSCALPNHSEETLIPAWALRNTPGLSYKYVRVVRITVHSAKNIKIGKGVPIWFSAQPEAGSAEKQLNFTKALYTWAMHTPLSADHQFCSFTTPEGVYQPLTYAMMQDTIKACAEAFGFDPDRFATHSLRIGGASQLAANGASQDLIRMMGRWRSAPVCLDYQHASSEAYDLMLQLLLAPGLFSEKDIHMGLCLPPAPRTGA